MARVALVNAHWGSLFSGRVRRYNRAFPPLELLNIAAVLRRAGHSPVLWDARVHPQARARLGEYDLALVTLSPLDRWQCPNTDLDAIDRFLAPLPRDKVVLMGAQVTVRPDVLLRRTGAAGGILGEPEGAAVALANGQRCGEVPGTVRLDETLVEASPGAALDLLTLPTPAFDLIDFRDYQYEVLGGDFGLLELTRGCPWRCHFCLLTMYGKRYRKKSVAQMMVEIQAAMAAGMRRAYFQDLEMTADRDLVHALCDALIASGTGLTWACQTRPDTVDRALLAHMRRAGCELIHYGVESGVDRVVALTGKGQPLATVVRAVEDARAVGMRTLCYFLIGLPTETLDEMWRTFQFAVALGPTYASFQVATPYPTTPFHTTYAGDDPAPFPSEFRGSVPPDELRRLAREFTLRFHLSPKYVGRRLLGPGKGAALREAGLILRYAMGG